jgi:hypothetical protein
LVAGVVEQADQAQLRPVGGGGKQHRRGRVPAAVVDDEQLVADAESVEQRPHPVEEDRQHLLLVVHRHDDGEIRNLLAHRAHPQLLFGPHQVRTPERGKKMLSSVNWQLLAGDS